ncbi:ralA-binding protein 1-like isoform X2 [Symsagittifera roscoffensis]|uniref:ralA-binding protein 1-like isoform X2 n=1 Tax=Symsagittifera roscoffensis TaxID=84072 RepID=UPI00307C64CF
MLEDSDSDEREGFFSNELSDQSSSTRSPPTLGILKTKNNISKSLPYPSLGTSFVPGSVNQIATESTDEDGLDEKAKALKKKNKLFRNFSKHGTKETKKKEKLFHKRKSSKNDEGSLIGVFGFSLSLVTDKTRLSDGIALPQIVRDCIDAVERNGLDMPGIYKNEVPKNKVDILKDQYDHFRVKPGSLVTVKDIHEVANLLKCFLFDLPDPIFTSTVSSVETADDKTGLHNLTKFLNKQPNESRTLFLWIISHFHNVLARSNENGVVGSDIVQLLSYSLRIHSTQFLTSVLLSNKCILQSPLIYVSNMRYPDALFSRFENRSIDSASPDQSTRSKGAGVVGGAKLNNACGESPPDSPTALRKDLRLYEDLLGNLHTKMEDPLADKGVEEELWEVQRIVTTYKRKLRALKTNQNDDKSSQASTNSSTKEVTTQSEPKSATETCDISDAAAVKPPPVVRHNSGDAGIAKPNDHQSGNEGSDVSKSVWLSEDTAVWNEFLRKSELEMKEQLVLEILSLRKVVASKEAQKAQLVHQVAVELDGATVDFKMKGHDSMTVEERAELARSQADTEAICRRMAEEVDAVCKRQADLSLIRCKAQNESTKNSSGNSPGVPISNLEQTDLVVAI